MKKTFTILTLISAILSILLAVLPISNLAIFPAGAALIFGLLAFYFYKKQSESVNKLVPFSFLLTSCALVLITYKAFFITTEVENIDDLENTEILLEEQALDELETIDFDDLEGDNSELKEITIEDNNNPVKEDAKTKATIPDVIIEDDIEDIKIDESELNNLEFDAP